LAHPKEEWQKEMKDFSKLAPVIQMVAGKTGVIQFFSPAVKADMVAGYSVVPSTGWGVMIPQPISELEERATQFYYLAFIISFAGLVAAMLLGWWLSRYITKPIIATIQAASMLTKDIPSPQTKLHKKPIIFELKRLFESFNEMAEQVKKAHLTLEERVQKRTLALKEEMEERKALEDKFRYMANHDKLTGLPNRNLFMDRLYKALQHGARAHHCTALFFIDLDGFKEVNDRLGHLAGDYLLVEVGKRIQRAVRENDTVGRYGGDEFTVLLVDAGNYANIEVVAQKILDKIIEPIQIKTKEVSISGAIGIAMTEGGGDSNMLLQEADIAMYKAKEKGKRKKLLPLCLVKCDWQRKYLNPIISKVIILNNHPNLNKTLVGCFNSKSF
jgi:diguanylate cyclase (GGDEF)-like protein